MGCRFWAARKGHGAGRPSGPPACHVYLDLHESLAGREARAMCCGHAQKLLEAATAMAAEELATFARPVRVRRVRSCELTEMLRVLADLAARATARAALRQARAKLWHGKAAPL